MTNRFYVIENFEILNVELRNHGSGYFRGLLFDLQSTENCQQALHMCCEWIFGFRGIIVGHLLAASLQTSDPNPFSEQP